MYSVHRVAKATKEILFARTTHNLFIPLVAAARFCLLFVFLETILVVVVVVAEIFFFFFFLLCCRNHLFRLVLLQIKSYLSSSSSSSSSIVLFQNFIFFVTYNMGITSFGWSRPAIASNRSAAHGYSNYSNSSKRFCGSEVNRNSNLPNTSLGLQGQLVGRGGEGYNLRSCSQIMSGVVDVWNDNLSIGSCVVQKPGNHSSDIIYGGDVDHERLHRGSVTTGGGLPERRGDDHNRSQSLYAGAGSGVNDGRISSAVGVHHDHRRQPAGSVPKFGSIGVATEKNLAIANARINEKLAHLSADLRHNLFCVMHPRVLRLAAEESNIAIKSVATGLSNLRNLDLEFYLTRAARSLLP
jgi:hypothetical protein